MSFISYAQNYEDVMLARALRGVEQGFYIDVGAQDPIEHSVTKAFYASGWRGINIEPVTYWFQKLIADRPRDVNLQLAVSETAGHLHLFEISNTGLSTTNPEFAERHARAGFSVCETDVESATLDEICAKQGAEVVHFLKVDCEGAEAAVLRGCSFDRVRPWIVLVEATEPLSQEPTYAAWEPLLIDRGYHFVYGDGLNRFYVADEHHELDEAFSYPPNVFDEFLRAPEATARRELGAVQGELTALRHNVEYLHNENERREAALVEHREREALSAAALAEQRRMIDQSMERESLMQAELTRLHGEILLRDREVDRLHREVHLRDEEVAGLHDLIHALHRSTSWRVTFPLRFLKRGAHGLTKAVGQILYFILRWPARLARPLLRAMAGLPWLRPLAARLGRRVDGRLVQHARLFLFGPPDSSGPGLDVEGINPSAVVMTRRAKQVLEEIQDVRRRRGSDHPSRQRGA